LAIASRIVKAHSGSIRASSEGKGRGTSVAIELPIRSDRDRRYRATRAQAVMTGESASEVRLDDLRLLVVDDDEDTRLLLNDILADRGAVVGQTPAIALAAYSRSEDAVRAIAVGYQLHAVKPVNVTVLLSSVAELAGRRPTS
jgi:two-component system, chemotaxis family, CheB/CheR fusion protein